jgi:hypothetical protein
VLEDVDNIIDICKLANTEIPPYSVEEVSTAINSLNTGKAQDVSGLSVEHFKYAGTPAIEILANVINSMISLGIIPDCIKIGLVTPVYKRKGDKTHAANYRGITVMPVISKILEVLLLEKLREILDPLRNPLQVQRGFTPGSSPMHCSLLLQEAILDARDKRKPVYIAYLDAKSAYDVVSHPSLLRKLFSSGVEGKV